MVDTNSTHTKNKLLIIGLDGATLDLVIPWAEAGFLPNLARLIEQGASGRLRSTIPAISPAAWTTMITGKNPGKHGVYDFIERRLDSYHLQYVQPELPRLGTVFRRLSELKRRVGVMGIPSTYPPEPVNGFMISGPWSPVDKQCVYPTDLFDYLQEQGYEVNNTMAYSPEKAGEFAQYLAKTTKTRAAVALELLQREAWDLFMVVFRDTDTVAHKYWQDIDETHPSHNPERVAKIGNVALDHYRQLDQHIGQMLACIDEHTSVMIVSDHGSGPLYGEVSINRWLVNEGLLALKPQAEKKNHYHQFLRKIGLTRAGIISRLGRPLARRLKRLLPDWVETLVPWPHAQLIERVDWSKTKAYSFGSIGQIHINVKGREPQGIVAPGAEYEALIQDITARLGKLQDPHTGRSVKVETFRREELYQGPCATQGPDLNLIFDDMSYITHITLDAVGQEVLTPPADYESGTHRLEGMFILWGPAVQEGIQFETVDMIDVAPMMMYLTGEPIPSDMDGNVLTHIVKPEFLAQQPPQSLTVSAETNMGTDLSNWTSEEEEKIHQHLKDLGYLE